jgi:hypothetical protein
MGSISMNTDGTIALGYNITSTTIYPGIRMTARTTCDPLNQMTAPEATGQVGTAANKTLDYGDYNGMVTDPVDGSFWFTAQYNVSNKWSTRVIHFTVDGCDDGRQTIARSSPYITLAPNPADSYVQIKYATGDATSTWIELYDMQGAVILQREISPEYLSGSLSIDVTAFPVGMYQCVLHAGELVSTLPMLVQH